MSSSDSRRKSTQNRKHQQDESPGVPIIAGIHRPEIRSRMDVNKENDSQYGSDSDYGSNIDEEDNYFQPHNSYASGEYYNYDKDRVVENW